jgi:hypothetical protein
MVRNELCEMRGTQEGKVVSELEALAKKLCPGCRDGLYLDRGWHVYADGSHNEKCRMAEILEGLTAAESRGVQKGLEMAVHVADLEAERHNIEGGDCFILATAESIAEKIRKLAPAQALADQRKREEEIRREARLEELRDNGDELNQCLQIILTNVGNWYDDPSEREDAFGQITRAVARATNIAPKRLAELGPEGRSEPELATELSDMEQTLALTQESLRDVITAIKPVLTDAEKAVNPEARLHGYAVLKKAFGRAELVAPKGPAGSQEPATIAPVTPPSESTKTDSSRR